MKRRAFLATAVAAAAGIALRRPKPEPAPFVGHLVDWGEPYYTYSFGAHASARCYGTPGSPLPLGGVTGVGEHEVLGLPPGFRLIEHAAQRPS